MTLFHPQALEMTSTGGHWMMARKRQRPGLDPLTHSLPVTLVSLMFLSPSKTVFWEESHGNSVHFFVLAVGYQSW